MNFLATRYSNKIIEICHQPNIFITLKPDKTTNNASIYFILFKKKCEISQKRVHYCTNEINTNQRKINVNESNTNLIIIKQYYLMALCNIVTTYAPLF